VTLSITPHELHELQCSGKLLDLIDVRTPAEFREVHVPFARNVPLEALDAGQLQEHQQRSPARAIYVICRQGNRSQQACKQLQRAGINAANIEGGTMAWAIAGLPVVRGKATIPLDGQVRIAIGLIVLVSSALAAFVHPYWIALAAFMGAGLIFSGVSGFCGLASILARMPWNQAGGGSRTDASDSTDCCRANKP
jgi:rhodanese-related sulfurtransferase